MENWGAPEFFATIIIMPFFVYFTYLVVELIGVLKDNFRTNR